MARSLLDTADLAQLRTLVAGGTAAAIAAAVVDSGLLQFDPDDAEWEDRDRLVVAGTALAEALEARLADAGARPFETVVRASGGDALAMAFGAAVASQVDGAPWRSWCVLDEAACDDGRVWEAARAAAWARASTLTALVEGASTVRMWEACGWTVHQAPVDDPAWLLSSLDQAVATSPAVVLAVPRA